MDRAGQSTDAENSKAPHTSKNVGKAKSASLGSAQAIARDTSNQNTATGSGATPVGANVKAGS